MSSPLNAAARRLSVGFCPTGLAMIQRISHERTTANGIDTSGEPTSEATSTAVRQFELEELAQMSLVGAFSDRIIKGSPRLQFLVDFGRHIQNPFRARARGLRVAALGLSLDGSALRRSSDSGCSASDLDNS